VSGTIVPAAPGVEQTTKGSKANKTDEKTSGGTASSTGSATAVSDGTATAKAKSKGKEGKGDKSDKGKNSGSQQSNNKEETKSKQKSWQRLKKKIKTNNKRLLILLLIFHLTKQKEKLMLKRVSVAYYLQMKKLEKDLKLVLQILEVKILGRPKEGQCRKSRGLKKKD
jgi:hypothetical protein